MGLMARSDHWKFWGKHFVLYTSEQTYCLLVTPMDIAEHDIFTESKIINHHITYFTIDSITIDDVLLIKKIKG